MQIEIADIGHLPLFNQDLEDDFPQIVTDLKDRIKAADGVLFATPEANFSFTGVLKNAIDWCSRPYGDNAFEGKPVIIQSASTGRFGGVRAQLHLRQVIGYLEMKPMQFPEVFVSNAKDAYKDGELADERAREQIKKQLAAFAEFVRKSS